MPMIKLHMFQARNLNEETWSGYLMFSAPGMILSKKTNQVLKRVSQKSNLPCDLWALEELLGRDIS